MIGEILMSLFILVVSLFLYYEATQLPQLSAYESVGPDFWPKLILLGMIIFSTYLTVSNLIKWKKSRRESINKGATISKKAEGWGRVLITTFLIIGYVYFLKPLGFIISTPLFIIGMMLLIRPERKKIIPVTVLGIMVIIYIIFSKLLFVPLPKGFGIFHDISIILGL